MIIDSANKEQIEKGFRIIFDYKEDAKQSNASASEQFNSLAEITSADKTKEGIKRQKKVLNKAYKEWQESIKQDDTIDDAIIIVEMLRKEE